MAPRNEKNRHKNNQRKSRLKRVLLGLVIATPVSILALWVAVHTFPSLGPFIADTLRAVIGVENVSRLEDFAYGLEDRWNQFWRSDEAPKAYWDVPETSATTAPVVSSSADADGPPPIAPFAPAAVGPMHKALAAKGDGVWVRVADPLNQDAPVLMHKTLLHPDPKRPWTELFVVALDLRRIELHSIAGSAEPRAHTKEGRAYERSAVIPQKHHEALLAGFNGGFKAEHGRWGMRIDNVTLIKPRKHGCTVGKYPDGRLRIAPWPDIEPDANQLVWWRQTPPCMYLNGKRHGGLWDPDAKGWGAALEGETVIRRSAIGLNAAGDTLFVAMSNHTNARAIADGMHHAGAVNVAQLDVNWSFPRFMMFPKDATGTRVAESLFEGFDVTDNEYIRDRNKRDFFYVVRTDLGHI